MILLRRKSNKFVNVSPSAVKAANTGATCTKKAKAACSKSASAKKACTPAEKAACAKSAANGKKACCASKKAAAAKAQLKEEVKEVKAVKVNNEK